MVRGTHGVLEGAWYFVIKVAKLGESGRKIHEALREKYGEEGYKKVDVNCFNINLPDRGTIFPRIISIGLVYA